MRIKLLIHFAIGIIQIILNLFPVHLLVCLYNPVNIFLSAFQQFSYCQDQSFSSESLKLPELLNTIHLNRKPQRSYKCAWHMGNDTTKMCGLEVSVALLKEVCHCGVGLWGLVLKRLSVERASFWFPVEKSLLLVAFGSRGRTFCSSSIKSAYMRPWFLL